MNFKWPFFNTPPAPELTDEELLNRIAGGDRQALGRLVDRHQERVWKLAYRVTQRREDADDIAQEAFLRVWRSASTYTPNAKFSTWLHRVVVNLCIDLERRKKPHLALVDERAIEESDAVDAAERADRVRQSVGDLPERQRLAVVLHRYEGLSYEQIGEVTGWSQGAIESLISRAYAALRQELSDLAPTRPFSPKDHPAIPRSKSED